ncbi:guanylate kinase [Caldichromatium japonicum]|uniref:Guanylate kinase n=1 Tax=Caldichromatium japonicum TaxID=2699430 RepID=A0A6G7V9X6_9GAMM|nr:guanylate kinase [Caldichromatium japonicum]QIK36710.1 guanylate kinase [Caldichromatium japonicum]
MTSSSPSSGLLFIVSAPSGAGKTSLVRALLECDPGLSLSISCTTRPPRAGEQDGVHYHFLDRAAFDEALAAGAFLEYAQVFDHLYGTRAADVIHYLDKGSDLLLEIDWQGARQVRARFPEAISIFILPPTLEELERRLRERRTDSSETIARRMAQAHAELAHWTEYDYLVVNDRFEAALAALHAIVTAARHRVAVQRQRLKTLLAAIDAA